MRRVLLGVALGIASSGLMAQRSTQTFPDAVRADPAHYSVSFENELVRILRVRYGQGARSFMHTHPANCVIFLTDQNFNFEVPEGPAGEVRTPAGQVGCGDANVHLPENIGGDAEMVIVEFKNRQTFRD